MTGSPDSSESCRLSTVNSVSKRDRLRWALLLVAACAVVYANGVTGAFTYDDKAVVRDNPRIHSPRNLREIFTTSYFGGRGTGTAYRPMLLLSFAIQWWVHGKQVVAFHVINILFHAAATLLLASLLLRIGLAPPAVAAAALLFAVHPIHVEAVTSLVGRGETQSAVFVLLYLHCALTWIGGREAGGGRTESASDSLPLLVSRLPALIAALVCYASAILTKESGAVAPGLAFLLFLYLAEGTLIRRLLATLVRGSVLFLLSAGVLAGVFLLRVPVLGGALRSSSSGIFEVENALAPLPPGARMANACVLFFRYLGRCVFPLHLSADESAWSIRPFPALSVPTVAAVVLLFALTAASLNRVRSRSLLALGFLFFAVASLPTGNLLFPIGTIFAERTAYLPSAGICIILGAFAAGGPGEPSPRRRRALMAIALLFSLRTVVRNTVWWTDRGLFDNLVATAPSSAKAHYDVAYVAADNRRYPEARAEYLRATAIYDRYWDAWAGKGRVEREMGLLADAERSYLKAIEIHPGYENGYFGLGLVREGRGDDAGAENAYRRGVAKIPRSLPLAYRLALVSGKLNRASASEDWRRALSLGGRVCSVRTDYAAWLIRGGQAEEAARQAREALRHDSNCAAAWRVLAGEAQRRGRRLARELALEKAFRASKSAEDRSALELLAREDPGYAARFRSVTVRK